MSDRLLTPRFLIMCAYTFTVFVSVFQLLPTAPYHVTAVAQCLDQGWISIPR